MWGFSKKIPIRIDELQLVRVQVTCTISFLLKSIIRKRSSMSVKLFSKIGHTITKQRLLRVAPRESISPMVGNLGCESEFTNILVM